jgi:hypothetical protein
MANSRAKGLNSLRRVGGNGNLLIHRRNYILLSPVYCVWQVVRTPTIILNNPVQVANLRKPLDIVRIGLCTTFRSSVQFRVQSELVELDSRYIALSPNSNNLPLGLSVEKA